ncbi:MAG TPA: FG-GAP-like repeat-containing protein [Gemmatimonadales bacterium]
MSLKGRAAQVGMIGCAACGGGAPSAAPAPEAEVTARWEAVVSPFPVVDSAGRMLDLAFLGGLNLPRPQLADLDGDGDLDLTIQEYTGRMLALTREGDGPDGLPHWTLSSWRYGGLDVGEWSRLVDLNGDRLPDLFAERPYSYLRFFRNRGTTGQPWLVPVADSLRDTEGRAIFSDRQNIPQIVDVDCDGRVDLLIGRITGVILHYELVDPQDSIPVFRLVSDRFQDLEIITGQGSMHGANTMAFADPDGDGDLDLFWGDFFEAGLLHFENVGSCAEPHLRKDPVRFPPEDPVVTSGYNAPAFGDLDRDGRLDLIVGVLGGSYDPIRTTIRNLHYYSREAGGGYRRRTAQLLPMIDVGSESLPGFADLDGDGDLDFLLANKIDPVERRTSRIFWYENTGRPGAPAFAMRGALPVTGQYHWAPTFGDLDGDGGSDMLLGSFGASVAWYRLEAGPRPGFTLVDSALVTITRGSNTTPAMGDVDGDGDLDLLVGEASGVLNFYRNDGTPRAPRFVLVSDEFDAIDIGRRSAPLLTDIDGDGDLDLLIGSDDQGVVLYRNRGTRSVPRFERDPSFQLDLPPATAPAAADLDGDGRLELIIGTAGGGALYFRLGAPGR